MRVLLVEDMPSDNRRLSKKIARAGIQVSLECGGDAAVHLVEKNRDRDGRIDFDVIVLDLQAEIENADTTSRRLREIGFEGTILDWSNCDRSELWQVINTHTNRAVKSVTSASASTH